ncbi:MAG: type III secretion system chaperone [Gammaproteobacteria bacterium]|nr:type III secretion system chaperone [Gammaproteobacteria bacterium]
MSLASMENMLSEFGASIGIPDLRPDAEHRCNLMFDEVAVSFELGVDDESIYIYALLGSVPEGDERNVYADLLHANYVFDGTGGATLCVDPGTQGIVLLRAERLESLRLARFEALLEDFVNVAERWMKRAESGELGASTAADAPAEAQPSGGMMRV